LTLYRAIISGVNRKIILCNRQRDVDFIASA